MQYELFQGDCIEGMRAFPDNSFDSIVTDPPYELGFMGKAWDASGIANNPVMWAEALRVLKPGGHLLAFSGSRTYHRMTCAIEDAGFEIRDSIAWLYGSGFPKSLDVSKAIDKAAGAVREVIGPKKFADGSTTRKTQNLGGVVFGDAESRDSNMATAPATDAARQWEGWGTALKPAHEPICVARKPLAKGYTVAANVLAHGTGALNIDGCRVAGESTRRSNTAEMGYHGGNLADSYETGSDAGRWPANLIHDGSDEVVALFGEPARFFYCAKTSKADRGANTHPTVKPTELMAYLCRLVTPPGGLILDPFMGSGSTGKAAMREGFRFIGCELSAEYLAIAEARISHELIGDLV